jgi:hypothetical protein
MVLDLAFAEGASSTRTEEVSLAHLSIEVGHLYMEDFAQGRDRVAAMAQAVAPWVEAARQAATRQLESGPLRSSTCFLIDDYFNPFGTPDELLPMIVDAYAEAGVPIDYIARESACAHTGVVPLAELVVDHLVPDPPPGSDGSNRPGVRTSGWLANGWPARQEGGLRGGTRPPPRTAMDVGGWQPPRQNAVHRHSVFIDVELWNDAKGEREWSCPFLASVWQLLRLGALRYHGEAPVTPVPWSADLAPSWRELPPIMRIAPRPQPFAAHRTFSVLDHRFVAVEHAVRAILSQVAIDGEVEALLAARAKKDGLALLPSEPIDRITYAFID